MAKLERRGMVDKALDAEQPSLENRLEINMDKLDQEIIDQPELYRRAATRAAVIGDQRDQLKEELQRLEAQKNLDFRTQLEEGGKKFTEAVVSNLVREDGEVAALREELRKKNSELDLAVVLKDSFIQKSHMLRNLVDLTVCGWMQSTGFTRSTSEPGYDAHRRALSRKREQEKT